MLLTERKLRSIIRNCLLKENNLKEGLTRTDKKTLEDFAKQGKGGALNIKRILDSRPEDFEEAFEIPGVKKAYQSAGGKVKASTAKKKKSAAGLTSGDGDFLSQPDLDPSPKEKTPQKVTDIEKVREKLTQRQFKSAIEATATGTKLNNLAKKANAEAANIIKNVAGKGSPLERADAPTGNLEIYSNVDKVRASIVKMAQLDPSLKSEPDYIALKKAFQAIPSSSQEAKRKYSKKETPKPGPEEAAKKPESSDKVYRLKGELSSRDPDKFWGYYTLINGVWHYVKKTRWNPKDGKDSANWKPVKSSKVVNRLNAGVLVDVSNNQEETKNPTGKAGASGGKSQAAVKGGRTAPQEKKKPKAKTSDGGDKKTSEEDGKEKKAEKTIRYLSKKNEGTDKTTYVRVTEQPLGTIIALDQLIKGQYKPFGGGQLTGPQRKSVHGTLVKTGYEYTENPLDKKETPTDLPKKQEKTDLPKKQKKKKPAGKWQDNRKNPADSKKFVNDVLNKNYPAIYDKLYDVSTDVDIGDALARKNGAPGLHVLYVRDFAQFKKDTGKKAFEELMTTNAQGSKLSKFQSFGDELVIIASYDQKYSDKITDGNNNIIYYNERTKTLFYNGMFGDYILKNVKLTSDKQYLYVK